MTTRHVDTAQKRYERDLQAAQIADGIESSLPDSCPPPAFVHAQNRYGVSALIRFGDQYGTRYGKPPFTVKDALLVAQALPANAGTIDTFTDSSFRYTVPTFFADDNEKMGARRDKAPIDCQGAHRVLANILVTVERPEDCAGVTWYHRQESGQVIKVEVFLPVHLLGSRSITYEQTEAGRDSVRILQDNFTLHNPVDASTWGMRYARANNTTPAQHVAGWHSSPVDGEEDVSPIELFTAILEDRP